MTTSQLFHSGSGLQLLDDCENFSNQGIELMFKNQE